MNSVSSIRKSCVIGVALASLLITCWSGISSAQEKYPSRNIDLVIVFNPGGTTDTVARVFADELTKVLNVPIIPINKAGASGTIGAAFVAQAKKDGYTLLAGAGSGMSLAPLVLPNVPFKTLRDFVPIGIIATSPIVIYVKNDSPLKSFEDLIDNARKNPDKLTYGDPGTGSDGNFFMEQLQMVAKAKFSHVPFKGGGEVMPAVMGGHIDLGVSTMAGISNQLRAGALRVLILSQEKRVGAFPDIPAITEKGYKGYFITHWTGLLAPAGISQSAVNTLFSAYDKVTQSKNYIKRIEDLGCGVRNLGLEEFKKFLEEEEKVAESIARQMKKK